MELNVSFSAGGTDAVEGVEEINENSVGFYCLRRFNNDKTSSETAQ